MKKYIFTHIYSLLLFIVMVLVTIFLVFPPSVSAATNFITNDWSKNEESLYFSEDSNGDMAMFEVSEDGNGGNFFAYKHSLRTWSDPIVLMNEDVEDAATFLMSDVSVVLLNPGWGVVWTTEYFDAEGNFLTSKYHVYHIAEYPTSIDDAYLVSLDSMLDNNNTEGEARIISAQSVDLKQFDYPFNDLFIAWLDEDDMHIAVYETTNRGFTNILTFNNVDFNDDVFVQLTNDDRLYVVWTNNSTDTLESALVNYGGSMYNGIDLEFSRTASNDSRSRAIDVTLDEENNVYALYQMGREIKRIYIKSDGSIEDREVVFKKIKKRLPSENVEVSYNNFGNGQYDVAIKSGRQLSVAHWLPSKGWIKKKNFFTGSAKRLSVPQVRQVKNGETQIAWKYRKKWYIKNYSVEFQTWDKNKKIQKNYGKKLLRSPFRLDPVLSAAKTANFEEIVKKTGAKTVSIYRWRLGASLKNSKKITLPKKHKRVYHTVHGKRHFIILRKGDSLKSIIGLEKNLFN